MAKRKYKRYAHHFDGFDFSQFMQFMKDNPELMKMAGSMMGGQGGGQQQQQQPDLGITGQKQTWSGDSSIPLSNEIAGMANAINSLSNKGHIPVEEAMNLPGSYYANGGHLFDEGGLGYAQAAIGGVTNALNQWSGIDTSGYEKKVKRYGNDMIAASDNQELLNAWANKNYLNHVDKYDITGGNIGGEILGRINQNVTAAGKGLMTTGNWVGAVIEGATDLLGQGFNIFNTSKKMKRLNNSIDVANARRDMAFDTAASNLRKKQQANIMANYNAFGGPIFGMPYMAVGPSGYDIAKDNAYAKQLQTEAKAGNTLFSPAGNSADYSFAEGGGIHIAPSKKGTFTAAATKHGKSVQAFASQVLANPDRYSPAMVKKANFARNAAKWHADGGLLLSDDFTNGVNIIGQGGTHENNPHEGVPMGIAPDGAPNLVEEGEAIYKDYVFSNRIRVPKEVRNKYKLRGPKDMTFAEAFIAAQKESEERPNDPISADSLDNIAMILARTQEAVRGYEKAHKKALGGHKYDGLSDSWTPEEFYRVYGYYPESYTPAQNWTSEGLARTTGSTAAPTAIASATTTTATGGDDNSDISEAFWKQRLGDKWNDSAARLAYMQANPGAEGSNIIEPAVVTADKKTKGKSNGPLGGINPLRLAEPTANAAAVFSDILGMTNTPTEFDYIPPFQAVGYNPLGNYIPVMHFDTRYEANRRAQQAAATRNAIMQSTAPNRWANLLAADYNAQIAEGEALRQAAMQDYEMMLQREQFNRGTNQANSEMGLKAAMSNQDAKLKYAQAALQQAKMNDDAATLASSARAQNFGNLAESISNIGREQDAMDWRDMILESDTLGTQTVTNLRAAGWSDDRIRAYYKRHGVSDDDITALGVKAKGGKIRKRKKGLTY